MSPKITGYIILSEHPKPGEYDTIYIFDRLSSKVNSYIEKGWVIHGSLGSSENHTYYQCMVKYG